MPTINYINRTFPQLRADLIGFAKNYFPDTYNDFSPASLGMLFIEMSAYVGDILAFYQDTQIQESFIQHAQNPENLYALAYMLGYKPKVTSPATVDITFTATNTINREVSLEEFGSDFQQFFSDNNIVFRPTTDKLIFQESGSEAVAAIKAESATLRSITYTGSGEPYQSFSLSDTNIIRIASIKEADSQESWTEVDYLGQAGPANGKKFTTRVNSLNQLTIHFGAGRLGTESSSDPSNFLRRIDYGQIPTEGIAYTINYLVGGGIRSNVPANSIQGSASIIENDLNINITYTNLEPATGGRGPDSLEEIRQNSLASFGRQNRIVTYADYEAAALKLDGVYKAYAKQGNGTNVVDLFILSTGTNNSRLSLEPTNKDTKEKLKNVLAPLILPTTKVNIKDAFIINIGINYEIITFSEVENQIVLLRCNAVLINYFLIEKIKINNIISLAKLSALLDRVEGVQTVKGIQVVNLVGGEEPMKYSNYEYDVQGATRDNIVYPSYDPCIFEIKYPENDIKGRIV